MRGDCVVFTQLLSQPSWKLDKSPTSPACAKVLINASSQEDQTVIEDEDCPLEVARLPDPAIDRQRSRSDGGEAPIILKKGTGPLGHRL